MKEQMRRSNGVVIEKAHLNTKPVSKERWAEIFGKKEEEEDAETTESGRVLPGDRHDDNGADKTD